MRTLTAEFERASSSSGPRTRCWRSSRRDSHPDRHSCRALQLVRTALLSQDTATFLAPFLGPVEARLRLASAGSKADLRARTTFPIPKGFTHWPAPKRSASSESRADLGSDRVARITSLLAREKRAGLLSRGGDWEVRDPYPSSQVLPRVRGRAAAGRHGAHVLDPGTAPSTVHVHRPPL
jgi:hypothetical protein